MARFRLPALAANLLLALTTVVLIVGAIESLALVLVGLGVLHAYTAMETMLPGGIEDWRLAHITADEYREPDPVLLWRPVARRPYSSQRFKGPEVAETKPPGTFRIICYGDSNTDGPKRGGWPQRLQEVLDRDRGRDGPKYEVLNAGVAGYSSYQGLLRFRSEVGRFEPDLVLVSFGWNDLAPAIGKPDKQFEIPPAPLVVAMRALLHFRFYRVALYYLRSGAPPSANAPGQRVTIHDYLTNAREFVKTARDHHAQVALLTRPHRDPPAALADTAPNWRSSVPDYNQALVGLGGADSIRVLDVQGAFADRPESFADECHFTLEGHLAMAEWLATSLRSVGFLPQ